AADAAHVSAGVVVAKLGRSGQAMNDFLPRAGQLRGASQHFGFELLGVFLQVIVVLLDDQHVANAGNQLLGVDRLAEKVVHGQLVGAALGVLVAGGRQNNHGQVSPLLARANGGQNV